MPASARTTIEISKEDLHFSAAHFTIFGAGERENLHGHNFFVEAQASAEVGDDGLCFDYGVLKGLLRELCAVLDERTLLPARSPHLAVESGEDGVVAVFGDERLAFLARDARVLDVSNVTVEELARWFVDRLSREPRFLDLAVAELRLGVSSGPGQWARATWRPDAGSRAEHR